MREILFRGKCKKTGKWLEGDYDHFYSLDGIFPMINIWGDESINAIPDSIGEYSGICDDFGVKIFEGDIVAGALWWFEKPKNGVVVFREGSFGLLWHRGKVEQFSAFTSICNMSYKVIGNIHDNPELLEDDADV